MTVAPKKQWIPPQITVLGDVETITQKNKVLGVSDGFTFNGVPISG